MATTPLTTQHYIWTFPGAPVRICVQLDVVSSLQEILASPAGRDDERGVEQMGILLGRMGGGNGTEITAALPSLGEESHALASTLQALRNSGDIVPVGFYRTQADESLRLSDHDFEIARAHFSAPGNVFLVIHPSKLADPKATFFFWDNGHIHRDFAFLEFPLNAPLLASRENRRSRNGHERKTALQAVAEPAQIDMDRHAPRPSPPPAARRRAMSVAVVAVIAVLLAAGILFWKFRPASTAKTTPPPAVAVPPSLGLKFLHQGADLVVTWDREAAARYGVAAGLLSIREANREKEIGLNADQLRSANILLSPESDQVQIQLTLLLSDQKTLSESAMALLPSRGSTDSVVHAIPIPPRPVSSARIVQRSPNPAALKNFTLEVNRTAADRPPLVEDAPVVNTTQSNRVPNALPSLIAPPPPSLPAPGPNPPVTVEHAAPPGSKPLTSAPSASAPAETVRPSDTVEPARFLSGKNPAYPPAAHQAHVQGTVVIDALVGPDGSVKEAKIVSGHPMLRDAARKAVLGWTFSPALIHGKPVDGPTRVEVKFHGEW
jgi:TonB family protein